MKQEPCGGCDLLIASIKHNEPSDFSGITVKGEQ